MPECPKATGILYNIFHTFVFELAIVFQTLLIFEFQQRDCRRIPVVFLVSQFIIS